MGILPVDLYLAVRAGSSSERRRVAVDQEWCGGVQEGGVNLETFGIRLCFAGNLAAPEAEAVAPTICKRSPRYRLKGASRMRIE